MRIGLLTDLQGQRTWHHWLAADVAQRGHTLILLRPDGANTSSIPAGLRLAFLLDPIVFRLRGEHAFGAPQQAPLAEHSTADFDASSAIDVLIDCSACSGPRPHANRTIRLLFNGHAGELAAVAAVLAPGAVSVTVENEAGVVLEIARPAIELRARLTPALDNLFTSAVELLTAYCDISRERPAMAAAARANDGDGPRRTEMHRVGVHTGPAYLANIVTRKVARYLDRTARTPNRWAIGTRRLSGESLASGAWPAQAVYAVIPDDGRRYYSDPILFARDGRLHLFAEEYPMATGKGIISVADVDEHGNAGPFRPIIERDFHLSYPFVFGYGGAVWMIPEASASGSLELYRAVDFPDRWVTDRTLLDGVPACDATILDVAGTYYMVLTASRRHGSTWDKQYTYMASSPLGPWHQLAPDLQRIDCTSARPAGPAFRRGNALVRPAQDCSKLYGGSMSLLEIETRADGMLRETPLATIKAVAPSCILGTHTYSTASTPAVTVEAIDVWGEVSQVRHVTLECAAAGQSNDNTIT